VSAIAGPTTAVESGSAAKRVPELSFFFPAHNEEANLEALVEESLAALPALADRFEIIAVDDGSKDRTPAIADALAAAHPDIVRVVHHPVNLGYGAALRSGFRASRYGLIAFIDGDRQFRVADVARLTERLAAADAPDLVVGYRIKRADPFIRRWYARTYRLANRIFFGVRVRDIDCACKLFKREALEPVRIASGGAFFTAEMLIKLRFVFRAVRDFWSLRFRLWFRHADGMRRGEALLGQGSAAD
jgi:glycosyltransferase involved in cell wall biosynthesis